MTIIPFEKNGTILIIRFDDKAYDYFAGDFDDDGQKISDFKNDFEKKFPTRFWLEFDALGLMGQSYENIDNGFMTAAAASYLKNFAAKNRCKTLHNEIDEVLINGKYFWRDLVTGEEVEFMAKDAN